MTRRDLYKILFDIFFKAQEVRHVRRLIRGLGASTSDSRTGFYTTLVAYLSTARDDQPTISTLFEFMEATLSVGAGSSIEKVSRSDLLDF